jgi:hypothetical protein
VVLERNALDKLVGKRRKQGNTQNRIMGLKTEKGQVSVACSHSSAVLPLTDRQPATNPL